MKLNSFDIFCICSFAFMLLLILKLNGYCDYSAKYDIEDITCNEIDYQRYFIVDKDDSTIWGLEELHYNDEKFIIRFKKTKVLSDIAIITHEDKNISGLPKTDIESSENGKDWHKCTYEVNKDGELIRYNFTLPCKGKYISLIYKDENPGYWPIKEIEINE